MVCFGSGSAFVNPSPNMSVVPTDTSECESLRIHEFSNAVVLDVNVLRFVRSPRIVGEFYGSFVIFVDFRGAALPLVDIVHELPEVHSTLTGPADCYILRFRGRESSYLLLLGNLADRPSIKHNHLS
jgi:hypothetical protein